MSAAKRACPSRFDSTIGRGTVMMPFGGKTQLTPSEGMVGRIPPYCTATPPQQA